eukprot:Lankesteria_metandrocarpae@DN4965_c0_g1_i1.p2
MLSSLFLMNFNGTVLVHRLYRSDVTRSGLDVFGEQVVSAQKVSTKPINLLGNVTFLHISSGNLLVVGATKANSNAILILRFLFKVAEVLENAIGTKLNEASVHENCQLILEIFDEVADYGVPQILEIEALRHCITQGRFSKATGGMSAEQLRQVTVQATGGCPWRREGIKYQSNEVYIDVVESVQCLISQRGQLLQSDVSGQILVKCHLSGMPECKFGMNDRYSSRQASQARKLSGVQKPSSTTAVSQISIDDVRFHQCVRLANYESDHTITFIPPDGSFELMRYRITDNVQLPFKVIPIVFERSRNKLECRVRIKATFERAVFANNVVVRIPCPPTAAKSKIVSVSSGKAKYEASQQAIMWRIKRFAGMSDSTLHADVDLAPALVESTWNRPPVTLQFVVPMYTASQLTVRYLKLQEKSNYTPVKWIRYLTKAASYQIRI